MKRFFWVACTIQAALLPVSAALALLLEQPVLADLHWSVADLALGVAGSVPLCLLFWWMLRSSFTPFTRVRRLLVDTLRPLFAPWSLVQLGTISLLAGIGEEVLFRSVIQGALSTYAGPTVALVVASVLFGCVHFVSVGYAIFATAIGIYLGLLWIMGGNLLIPIVTHAAYDFIALVYFLRVWHDSSTDSV